jgi:hypothetical protein
MEDDTGDTSMDVDLEMSASSDVDILSCHRTQHSICDTATVDKDPVLTF